MLIRLLLFIALFVPHLALAKVKVAIVGGGLAGMTALYKLQKAQRPDLEVTLFESTARLGGRVKSFENKHGPGRLDGGASFIDDVGQEAIFDLMREIGWDPTVELMPAWLGEETWTGTSYLIPSISAVPLIDSQLIDLYFSDANYLKAMKVLEDHKKLWLAQGPGGDVFRSEFAAINMAQYLNQLPQWAGVPADSIPWLVEVLRSRLGSFSGKAMDEFTSLEFISRIEIDIPRKSLRLGSTHDESWRVRGGTQRFIEALAAKLDLTQVNLNHHVLKVGGAANGKIPLTVQKPDGLIMTADFDKVILAVPAYLIDDLLKENADVPAEVITEFSHISYGRIAKIFLHYRNRPWELNHHWGVLYLEPDITIFPDVNDTLVGESVLLAYLGGAEADHFNSLTESEKEIYVSALQATLETVWPGGDYVGFNSIYWQSAYSTADNSEAFFLKTPERAPIGGIYFTGDYFSVHNNGYMAGAVESANRAVNEILPAH